MKELLGKTIEGWTAVRIESRPGYKRLVVAHGCGSEKRFRCKKEFLDNSGVCGKCSKYTPLDDVFKAYAYSAKYRELDFTLSPTTVKFIVSKPCHYCGVGSSRIIRGRHVNGYWWNDLHCNGIDRLDAGKGYVLGNVVSACYRCNKAKGEMSVEDFYEFVYGVVKNG